MSYFFIFSQPLLSYIDSFPLPITSLSIITAIFQVNLG